MCEVLRLFEGYFEVVSSVALRVVLIVALSVVLRLFEGVSELVLRLFEDPLEGYFEVV